MKKFIGTKIIHAEPQVKDGVDGYKVVYSDNYTSWSPKNVFEEAYREIDNMSFGLALEALRKGFKVARKGWNGKNMFLYYVSDGKYPAKTDIAKTISDENGNVEYCGYIAIKTVQGYVSPWNPSQMDMLAEDWIILE